MTDEELGPFEKADPTVVADDPFWAAVRRRHPDVDIVLLTEDAEAEPAGTGAVGPGRTASVEVVRQVTDEVTRAWQSLAPLMAARGAAEAPSVRWSPRDGRNALVVEKAVHGLGEDGGTELLRDVAFRLGADGWRLRPTTRGTRPMLHATNGLVDLRAEAGAGATVITLATGLMPVADADRGVLRDEAREQVAAW